MDKALPLEGPSPFLVFGGIVFASFLFRFPHRRRQTVGGKNDTYLDRDEIGVKLLRTGNAELQEPEKEGERLGSEALAVVSRRHSDA